jgi:flagellar L-ring protein precursor FlgH
MEFLMTRYLSFFSWLIVLSAVAWGNLVATSSAVAQPNAMWHRADHRFVDLVADVKAARPGDLLFILIQEQSDIENMAQRTLRKQNNSKSEGQASYSLGGDVGAASANGNFDQESAASRSFDGNTALRVEQEFRDQFTVKVIDVMPNGNLVVGGTRNVLIEGDTRKLILTGVVRSVDVSTRNSIPSTLVSDLKLHYATVEDEGAERRFLNQGWLGKKLNKLWPY